MTRGKGERYGTGFLIHPRVVLTAGHNLAYFPTGNVKKAEIHFGSIDSLNKIASKEILLKRGKNKFYKSNYFLFGSIKRDYAIIILPDSSVYEQVGGHFTFLPVNNPKTDSLTITGSPGDKELFEMWTESTTKYMNYKKFTRYNLFTAVRNSGSPIWYKSNDKYIIAGVHSRSYGNCGASVLITDKVYKKIKKWCRKSGIKL